MVDGGRLQWRVGAKGEPGTTKCGNPLPKQGEPTFDGVHGMAGEVDVEGGVNVDFESNLGRQLTAINLTTYGWVYTFPSASSK
jgi:hypothetical protein